MRRVLIAASLFMSTATLLPAQRPADGNRHDFAARVDVTQVPLNSTSPETQAIDGFIYAGGLQLTTRDASGMHELSDVEMVGRDRFTAVGDAGILVKGRLVLDPRDRLIGVTDLRVSPLLGRDGAPLTLRDDRDAEGLARLASGDLLISFERRDRVWLYPAIGGPPRPAPSPEVPRASNEGFEALAADPDAGPDAYIVGMELTGETWTCRLSEPTCARSVTIATPAGHGLVAIRRLPGGLTAYLLRAYDAERGPRAVLTIQRGTTVVQELRLARPETVDNFESLAVTVHAGLIRFYLVSDDNESPTQRTLILAFDWRPPA